MRFYCIRHGETESNLKRIYAGWSDGPLTSRGRQQARGAVQQLIPLGIEAIYCSPLRRTMETATIIGSFFGIKPVPEESFKELRMGPWEGKSEDQIIRECPREWQTWSNRPMELVLAGREPLGELLERTLRGLEKLRAEERGENLLIVTHVAIIRVLLLHFQGLDLNLYRTLHIPNCKVFSLKGVS